MLDEGVVLLCRAFGEWLEPVCVVRDAHLHSPLLHACGYRVGDAPVEACAVVHHVRHLRIDVGRQVVEHLVACKYILAEIFRRAFRRCLHVERLLLECLCDYLESQVTHL